LNHKKPSYPSGLPWESLCDALLPHRAALYKESTVWVGRLSLFLKERLPAVGAFRLPKEILQGNFTKTG
jgi:hypothetical protein